LFNFQSFSVAKTIGLPNGSVLQNLTPFQTTSRTIGERLYGPDVNILGGFPKFYRILNPNCNSVILNVKVPALYKNSSENGNIERTKVEYDISYRPLYSNKIVNDFSLAKHESIFGKLSFTPYVRSTRINFPSETQTYQWQTTTIDNQEQTISINKDIPQYSNKNFLGWELKIERTTPDSTTSLLQDSLFIESLTEIYGEIYTYPYCPLVRGLFDAQYFKNVQTRAFEVEGLKGRVRGN